MRISQHGISSDVVKEKRENQREQDEVVSSFFDLFVKHRLSLPFAL